MCELKLECEIGEKWKILKESDGNWTIWINFDNKIIIL